VRFLNKIVFVNSAHVRYAEINLNGNVHLIGTQGVGKSTLLRALLFFYNADKQKLGIPKEKKSFDDFYFELSNSYIVYEVVRDESAFCVLLSKANGRACFRFIDAPYCKDWLVDTSGEVTAEFSVIRSRLAGRYMSPVVDRYETYRDIIYGNHQGSVRKEFYKFSIAESSRYQNIPRSIQNVFLNSKLDADFIKETIIQSMENESSCINLGYFRHQVSEFQQEYEDIGLWFTKNKRGECETRLDADKVVNIYHTLLQLEHGIESNCRELNYTYRATKEQLPAVAGEISKFRDAVESLGRSLSEESERFNKDRDSLKREWAIVDENLKKLRLKKSGYESQNIDAVLKKQEEEGVFKAAKSRLEERRRVLTREFEDVAEKYDRLLEQVNRGLEEFRQVQKSRLNERESEKLNQEKKLFAEFTNSKNKTAVRFEEEIKNAENALSTLKDEKNSFERKWLELKYRHPFEKEMALCKAQLEKLNEQENDAKLHKAEKQNDANKLISARGVEQATNNSEFQKNSDALLLDRKGLLKNLESLDQLLERQKGSLYEWLSVNKPGWENSVGKVVDEESVLYQGGLSPVLKPEEDSLFGVSLNLDVMPVRVRTPEEIRNEKISTETAIAANKKAEDSLQNEWGEKNATVERSYGPKIKSLQDEVRQLEADLIQIPILKKRSQNELESLNRKDEEEIGKLRSQIQNALTENGQKTLATEEFRDKQKAARDREIKRSEMDYRERIEVIQEDFNNFKVQIRSELLTCEGDVDRERLGFKAQKDAELKDRNVDVSSLNECENELFHVQTELDDIEKHRELVTLYRRDKEEYFDREVEFKDTKRNLESKIDALQKKYSDRREKLNAQKQEQEKLLQQKLSQETRMREGIEAVDKFAISNLCPENLKDAGEEPNAKICADILSELTDHLVDEQRRNKELEVAVNKFKGQFSSRNTFKFRMELNTDRDYRDFADNLNDFLQNDKINDYRERTSGRYTDILSRIAKEVGDVTRQKSAIEKIIHDVNRDFVEKNFAGVIKSIALRTEESNDKLMRLMLRIQSFHTENQYAMGDLNLFSGDESENVNRKAVELLLHFVKALSEEPGRDTLKLSDAFRLQFRVEENDNDTGWIDKISNVGSEGTDVLVKAMVNIMLINVFKMQVSRKFGDFKLHCMMDEIGRLHPSNANGILKFANSRNIYLVNGSPTTQSVSEYRYTYLLEKNNKSQTVVRSLITRKDA
jgi:hypothetical protein